MSKPRWSEADQALVRDYMAANWPDNGTYDGPIEREKAITFAAGTAMRALHPSLCAAVKAERDRLLGVFQSYRNWSMANVKGSYEDLQSIIDRERGTP